MINGPTTYKAIAEALPYELKSALLHIRDDGATFATIPETIYYALYELMLIEEVAGQVVLSRAGKHLVNYCTC